MCEQKYRPRLWAVNESNTALASIYSICTEYNALQLFKHADAHTKQTLHCDSNIIEHW